MHEQRSHEGIGISRRVNNSGTCCVYKSVRAFALGRADADETM